jgi:hypothetical protein
MVICGFAPKRGEIATGLSGLTLGQDAARAQFGGN